jgi:hypothetical protein
MNFISYPLVLTPLVQQVRSCMSILEFNVYVGIWCWKQDFRIKFIKHLMRKHEARHKSSNEVNMTPRCPRTNPWRWKTPRTWTKCWILRDKELYPNHRETDVKGLHAEGRNFYKTQEVPSTKEATKWAEMGPGRPAHFEAHSCPL